MEKAGKDMVSGASELAGGGMATEGKGNRAGNRAASQAKLTFMVYIVTATPLIMQRQTRKCPIPRRE